MLQLRVYGDSPVMAAVARELEPLPGMRHVGLTETGRGGRALVTADVRSDAADRALATLQELRIPADDVALVRLDTIGPVSSANEPNALVWADVLGQARMQSRAPTRYLVLMAAAGVIAGMAVINDSATLLVGAMAISPDLYPITAPCTGLVLRRPRLVRRGLGTLVLGLSTASILAIAATTLLSLFDALPAGFSLDELARATTETAEEFFRLNPR